MVRMPDDTINLNRGQERQLYMSYSHKVREQFIELRAKGETIPRIAEQLKVSRRTIQYWAEMFEQNINVMHRTILEELLVKHGITRLGRIEKVGIQLEKVNAAIDGKDLGKERVRDLYTVQKLLWDRLGTLTGL
jgi:orotate phosphoribosyltransferase-like protein